METFGRKLREAVEDRGLRLDDVARATGFDLRHLEALQRDDYDALPDDEVVTKSLRAFAELVGVDPEEVIADYLTERARHPAAEPDPLHAVVRDVPTVPEEQPAASPPRRSWPIAVGLGAVALLIAGFLFVGSPTPPSTERVPAGETTASVTTAPAGEPTVPDADAPATPPADLPGPTSRVEPTPATGLTIARHGVGRAVVDHELVGESQQFAEGTRVWFWTQVQGATPGQRIRHVWLHEGREVLSVSLRLGGARWRTQSYKNLHPGSGGNWSVEVRDEAGQVLARSAFGCAPAASG